MASKVRHKSLSPVATDTQLPGEFYSADTLVKIYSRSQVPALHPGREDKSVKCVVKKLLSIQLRSLAANRVYSVAAASVQSCKQK